jgi:hypothetical protein
LMRTVETAHADMHDRLTDFLPVILWNLNILIEQIEICCVELNSHCSEVNLDLVLDRFLKQEDFIYKGESLCYWFPVRKGTHANEPRNRRNSRQLSDWPSDEMRKSWS